MDKSFEPVIMATYAELCVSWRMAHVAKLVQADDLHAKLESLEAVIKSFELASPQPNAAPTPKPKKAGDRVSMTGRKAAAKAGESVMLED